MSPTFRGDLELGDQIDQPIPYTITEGGRAALLAWDIEHHPSICHHVMRWAGNAIFECRNCGWQRSAPRQSSSAAYAPKGRYDR